MAIGKSHAGMSEAALRPRPVDALRLDQHVLDFAAMRAGVHPQRPADRAWNAAQEGQSVDAGRLCRLGDEGVRRRRARDEARILHHLDGIEGSAAEPDDDARHSAVADDEQFEPTPITITGMSAGQRDRK